MQFNLVYITTKDKKEARKIGRELVELRLAACANIVDGMESIYWWKGKIEKNREAVLLVKTQKKLISKLIKKVKELHSYECPCIEVLPITGGNPEYLAWLKEGTRA